MNWQEMTPEQRERLVHEKVMGMSLICHAKLDVRQGRGFFFWNCFECGYFNTGKDSPVINDHPRWVDMPPYTRDLRAAWAVLTRMTIASPADAEQRRYERFIAARARFAKAMEQMQDWWSKSEQELATAICHAALTACEVEI